MAKEKLVLIGNGMAGVRCIEEIIKMNPDRFDITIFGSEPYPNYNRIQLSKVLQGDTSIKDITINDWSWYDANHITLYSGETVVAIHPEQQFILTGMGRKVTYDKLILATGSLPLMLPIPGIDKEGVTAFRDMKDCQKMLVYSKIFERAVVIGGGLLGLEAARGLLNLGMDVTVVHLGNHLMDRQLDKTAGWLLQKELEKQGMKFLLEKQTTEVLGQDRVTGLRFSNGEEIQANLVVMAVGIKPNVTLAKDSGIPVNRGILVNDYMEAAISNIYAVGECAEHHGLVYGLAAPLYEQGKVLAKRITEVETPPYLGSTVSTQLKVSGVNVFSAGQIFENNEINTMKVFDHYQGIYKKILIQEGRIIGAVLFGDISEGNRLLRLIKKGADISAYTSVGRNEPTGGSHIAAMADDEIICGCNGVTKGAIASAVQTQGLTTVEQVKGCTNASRSCGGCKSLVDDVLQHTLGHQFNPVQQKEPICGCTPLTRDEVVQEIRDKDLTNIREVMNVLGWKTDAGCSKCRPALNYYLGMLDPLNYHDERESRFVNERLHANIQKDGTYSVVPRMYGGVTNPEALRKIADVAEKYQVPLIKLTGGQRIHLLGVRKEDLPNLWADLGMPSGYAYGKALRTVKTCVGENFCRFGTQDSIGMGIQLEKKFERLNTPHKVKMAVSACPRNCAESGIKDLGVVGVDGAWEIYVGGNGGTHLRAGDLFCKVKTQEEVLEIAGAYLQYYRETAHYLERTSKWVERMGLDQIKTVLADKQTREQLNERMDQALSVLKDPWQDAIDNPNIQKELYETLKVPADIT